MGCSVWVAGRLGVWCGSGAGGVEQGGEDGAVGARGGVVGLGGGEDGGGGGVEDHAQMCTVTGEHDAGTAGVGGVTFGVAVPGVNLPPNRGGMDYEE